MPLKNTFNFDKPSLGEQTQNLVNKYNNQNVKPFVGFVKSRTVGVIVKPCMRTLDAALYIIVGLGKTLTVIVILKPIHFSAKLVGKEFKTTWNIKDSAYILGCGTAYALDIFASPVINLINPNMYDWRFSIIRSGVQPASPQAELPVIPIAAPSLASEEDLQQAKADLAKVQAEKAELEARIKELLEQKASLERQHSEEESTLNSLREDISSKASEIEGLKKENESERSYSKEQIAQLENDLQEKSRELESNKQALQNAIVELNGKHAEVVARLTEEHTSNKALLESEIAKLKSEIGEKQTQASSLAAQVKNLEILNSNGNQVISALQKERSELTSQVLHLTSKIRELEATNKQIDAKHSENRQLLESEIANLRREIGKKETRAENLAKQVNELIALNQKGNAVVSAFQTEKVEFSAIIDTLAQRISELEAVNKQFFAEKQEALDLRDIAIKESARLQLALEKEKNPLTRKHRAVGQFFLWLKNKHEKGEIKLPQNILDKIPEMQEKLKGTIDLGATYLGGKVLSALSNAISNEDRVFLRQSYNNFIINKIIFDDRSKIIELGQQDVEDILDIISVPHEKNQNVKPLESLDEFVELTPEENRKAVEEMAEVKFDSISPPSPNIEQIEKDFTSISYKKADYDSFINYELIIDMKDAKSGVSIVEINGKKWVQYIRDPSKQIQGIRYRFSDQFLTLYDQLLEANDHSYAAANMFTEKNPEKLQKVNERHDRLNSDFEKLGWKDTIYACGSMGRDNVDADVPCVMRHNPNEKVVEITFHGSRIGSYFPFFHDGTGDWGANYDDESVSPDKINLDIKADVKLHKGFALNVQSVQDNIKQYLKDILSKVPPAQRSQYRVVFTGHSKGAAMANIGALLAKEYLDKEKIPAHVSTILFSSPRAIFEDKSQTLMDKIIGIANVVRVGVYGDPVTNVPPKHKGARSTGLLILDDVVKVRERLKRVAPQLKDQSYFAQIVASFAPYHYGSSLRGSGMEFDPRIVVRGEDALLEAFMVGLEHMVKNGDNPIERCPVESQ
jgi:septal ring factor EnvC (AmiA/AmiB activator)